MSCPQVIKVITPGPPGVGLPPGVGDAGKFLRKVGAEPYAYELVTPDAVGLPQALGVAASPTFAGLTLSGLAANRLLFTGTGGTFTGLTLGAGLSIVDGALVAAGGGGGATTEEIQDAAAALFTAGGHSNVTFTYDDAGNRVTAAVTGLAAVATSGAYGDLTGRPILGTAAAADVGVAGGVAPLDGSAKIASAYLPSFVDDVIEAANFAALPGTGETGKIYVTLNDGKTFRWGGSAYVEISPSPGSTDAVPEGSVNLYFTAARAIGSLLTGFTAGAGTVSGADSILQAIQKIVGNLAGRALTGAIGSSGLTMATARLLGRSTGGTGAVEEISLGSGLSLSGGTLSVSAGGGNVSTSGTPVAGQLAEWATASTVQGVNATGTGSPVRANSPTLVTPALGTPSSVNLSNGTGLPISTGVSGLGTGIASALTVNVGSAGAPVLFGGAAGTPSSLTLTNATGLPIAGVTGLSASLAAKADLVGGVIPTSQIPSVALVAFLGAVSSQSALLLLRGEPGDWAVRTDRSTTWVIVANNGASLADWYELPTGISPVGSVNGQTGSLVLGTGDISESGGNLYFTNARVLAAIPWAAPGAIGGTTPAAGTFSALAATTTLLLPGAAPSSPAAGHVYRIADTLRYRDSGAVERLLLNAADNLANLANTGTARNNLGLTAIATSTPVGALSLQSGNLTMVEGIALTISNRGETATVGNNYVEKAVRAACTVIGVTWELNPTTPSTGGSSAAMLYARRSGTKTNLLTANASLPVTTGIFTDVSATLTGTLTLAAGDSLGADLTSVGTGATGLILTVYVRYS